MPLTSGGEKSVPIFLNMEQFFIFSSETKFGVVCRKQYISGLKRTRETLTLKLLKNTTFLLLLSAATVFGQIKDPKFDSLITAGIYQIYNIKFQDAENTFRNVMKEYPHHPAGKFFDAMIIWWKIVLDKKNESYDDLFVEKLESVIEMCDSILENDPENVDAMFFKGGSLGFRGRLYALRKDWFNAALDGKEALPLVYKVYEIDPTNEEVKLGFGIYNYYATAIPEKYPFIKPVMIFFPEGDKELGIKQLKEVAQKAKYAKIEARFFLLTLYYQFEENYNEALKYAKILVSDFPDNPTFQRYYGRLYVKKGDYKKAGEIFGDILEKCKAGYVGYTEKVEREAVYYLGVKYDIDKKLDSALAMFQRCVELSEKIDGDEPSGFLVNSVLYLGMVYDQLEQRAKAIAQYNRVLDMDEYKNSHERAEKYLKRPYLH